MIQRDKLVLSHRGGRKVPNIQCLSCGVDIWLDGNTYVNYRGRVICPECKALEEVVIQNETLISASNSPDVFTPIYDILDWQIPQEILVDLAEAALDLGVNAFKSCAVMCGRCLQAVLLDKQLQDQELDKMIDDARNRNLITEELQLSAKAVRFFRNTGAHPQNPALRNVTKLQAQLGLEVTKEIMKYIFPAKPRESSNPPLS